MPFDFPNPSGRAWHKERGALDLIRTPEELALEDLAMTDPYERDDADIVYIIVEKVVRKRVPDYEAEVLFKHGWQEASDEFV